MAPIPRGEFLERSSSGGAAMLAVGRGLMGRSRVLVLDEASLGLAPTATARLFQQLGTLKASKVGILMDVADRSLVMRQGRQEHRGRGQSI